MDNINKLIEKYFEGLTSANEEAVLRRFFTSGNVPDQLAMYTPLFTYFDNEIKNAEASTTGQFRIKRNWVLWLSSVAACIALIIGAFHFSIAQKKCPAGSNYVIIDGRCYTDADMIHNAMQRTLREVSDDDDFFSETPSGNMNIVESQLKEFESLFNE